MESEREAWERFIADLKASVGRPGQCFCTGACNNGRTPERCPAYGHASKTWAELLEPSYRMAVDPDPRFYSEIKAAVFQEAWDAIASAEGTS